MKFPIVMIRYMAKTYLINMLFLLFVLLSIIYLFDTVELMRRANKRSDIPLSLMFQMAFLKLPEAAQVLFPFAILFSAMYTFWQLTKRYELIIIRASGFSVWQFLAPVIGVAIFAGFLQMSVINPVGSLLLAQFEQLERTHLKREKNQIAVFKEGLWLRQNTGDNEGYAVLHSPRITQPDWILRSVTVLYFTPDDRFEMRLDAHQATLDKGQWLFKDSIIHKPGERPVRKDYYVLPTRLTIKDVEESFSSPETMSFWRLPMHIETLEETGFDSSRLKVHYHSLLSQPLMFAAMVLLAATVSMRLPRFRGAVVLIGTGVFLGFIVFFLSSYLQALGASGQLPPMLAAWAPALLCFLLGTTVIMNMEDG